MDKVLNRQTLHFEMPTDLTILMIDQTSLERTLFDLLYNAHKFTPSRGIIIVKLFLELISAEVLKTLLLKVVNSGVENPVSEYSRIFRIYRIPGAIAGDTLELS